MTSLFSLIYALRIMTRLKNSFKLFLKFKVKIISRVIFISQLTTLTLMTVYVSKLNGHSSNNALLQELEKIQEKKNTLSFFKKISPPAKSEM